MRTIPVPDWLVREILIALNEVRNTTYPGERFRDTYALAAEGTRTLAAQRQGLPDATPITPPRADP
ncbi:MAG: hypothetical protein IPK85_22420 [Gemmatimonadetes bacterium]|nr:hypothetical protein [Gemmatimonadota bacterium]